MKHHRFFLPKDRFHFRSSLPVSPVLRSTTFISKRELESTESPRDASMPIQKDVEESDRGELKKLVDQK